MLVMLDDVVSVVVKTMPQMVALVLIVLLRCWSCCGFDHGNSHACLGGHCVNGLAQVRGAKGSIE